MDPKSNPLLDPSQYNLPAKHGKVVQPLPGSEEKVEAKPEQHGNNEAVHLLRGKIDKLYAAEPDAKEELAEAKAAGRHRSKHQQFMYELSSSGKSLAQIQTEWHNYYVNLPNDEKHEVWQEFYSEHAHATQPRQHHQTKPAPTQPAPHPAPSHRAAKRKPDSRTVDAIKSELLGKIHSRSSAHKPSHGRSLLFGLGMGTLVLLIVMFGFFNERFIAPLITPSRSVSSTSIIIDPSTTAVGPESKIIIPKINVEIPVIFDEKSIAESDIQAALEDGVVHYSTTSKPGELGNGAIFGHSSNNILNKGKYKFAFVLLNRLETGDTFMVQRDGKRYVYRVYKKSVVKPTDVEVLASQDRPATMSLITCDPPGTTINRLVVVGEQISPDPGTNIASSAQESTAQTTTLPGNAPSLWSRFTSWLSS